MPSITPSPHIDPTNQPPGSTSVTLLEHVTTLIAALDRHFDALHDDLKVSIDGRFAEADLRNQQRFADTDLRYQQRFDAQTNALDAALAAAKEAVQTALVAAEKATTKAEIAADKRFDAVNEFRGQLADQAATLMPRTEAEQRMNALAEKIGDMRTSIDMSSGLAAGSQVERRLQEIADLVSAQGTRMAAQGGASTGLHSGWMILLGMIGAVGTIVAIVLALTN